MNGPHDIEVLARTHPRINIIDFHIYKIFIKKTPKLNDLEMKLEICACLYIFAFVWQLGGGGGGKNK